MVANTFSYASRLCLGLHILVMIAGVHIPQEIFAIDILTAIKPGLHIVIIIAEHACDHVLKRF